MARSKAVVQLEMPWWLEEGSEVCSTCLLTYAYELDSRCVDCDAPMCPFCVEVEHVEIFCPVCRDCGDKPGGGGR